MKALANCIQEASGYNGFVVSPVAVIMLLF